MTFSFAANFEKYIFRENLPMKMFCLSLMNSKNTVATWPLKLLDPGLFLVLISTQSYVIPQYGHIIALSLRSSKKTSTFSQSPACCRNPAHAVLFPSFSISHCHSHALRCTELDRCVLSSKCLRCRGWVGVGLALTDACS